MLQVLPVPPVLLEPRSLDQQVQSDPPDLLEGQQVPLDQQVQLAQLEQLVLLDLEVQLVRLALLEQLR